MDLQGNTIIGARGNAGRYMSDEVRCVLITGLRQVNLVSHPGCLPLFPVAGLGIVRGANKAGSRGDIIIGTPMELAILIHIVLKPDLPQPLDCRNLPQLLWGGRGQKIGQQMGSILTNLFGDGLSLGLSFGQMGLLKTVYISIEPSLVAVGNQPVGSNDRQAARRKTHGFSNADQTVDGSNLGEHVRGIGSLTTADFEPSPLFKEGEHRI